MAHSEYQYPFDFHEMNSMDYATVLLPKFPWFSSRNSNDNGSYSVCGRFVSKSWYNAKNMTDVRIWEISNDDENKS